MNRKNLLIGGVVLAAMVCAGITAVYFNQSAPKEKSKEPEVQQQPVKPEPPTKKEPVQSVQKPAVKQEKPQKTDLYNTAENRTLPLSAIRVIAGLPDNVRKSVNKQLEHSNVYYLNTLKDNVIIIKDANTDKERFSRHDFEIVKVSVLDGKVAKENSYPLKMSNDESEHEIWQYEVLDGDTLVPVSHTSLNDDGSVKLTENWYYSENDPVKYKVTNKDDKTLSIRKTSSNEDGSWRDEHIFYDDNGETVLNVSTVYEDNNIARFTYYNAKTPEAGATIVNEYDDGVKTKEIVYSPDYKIENIYKAEYQNGERTGIIILDSHNQPIDKLSAE